MQGGKRGGHRLGLLLLKRKGNRVPRRLRAVSGDKTIVLIKSAGVQKYDPEVIQGKKMSGAIPIPFMGRGTGEKQKGGSCGKLLGQGEKRNPVL